MDIESRVVPAANLLHKGEADELFTKQKREDLPHEELTDDVIIEARDSVEGAVRASASLGDEDMEVGMEVEAGAEDLEHGNDSWHQLLVCN